MKDLRFAGRESQKPMSFSETLLLAHQNVNGVGSGGSSKSSKDTPPGASPPHIPKKIMGPASKQSEIKGRIGEDY